MEGGSQQMGSARDADCTQGLRWNLCSHMFMQFINYMEMERADVEKLINDNVIRGIKNKTAFLQLYLTTAQL